MISENLEMPWLERWSVCAPITTIACFQFRQGKLQRIGNEYRQKRVDILMAVDLVRISSMRQVDTAVIITGDSDIVPAIEVARDCGVVVSLYYSEKARHDELLQACDERHPISQDLIKTISR